MVKCGFNGKYYLEFLKSDGLYKTKQWVKICTGKMWENKLMNEKLWLLYLELISVKTEHWKIWAIYNSNY